MTTQPANSKAGKSRFISMEFLGEVLLLAVVGAFFLYTMIDSLDCREDNLRECWNVGWERGGWVLPRLTVFFGLPFWLWRVIELFRERVSTDDSQIMDTGFLETTESTSVVALRWVQLLGTTGGLLVGAWVFGFHIMVPVYTVAYLVILGKVKWYWTILAAIFFEGVILFIYGYLLLSEWGSPPAQNWPIIGDIWNVVIDQWHNIQPE